MRKMLYCDTVGNLGSIALLVLRVVVGAAFFMHGADKVTHAQTWMNETAVAPVADPTQPRVRPANPQSKDAPKEEEPAPKQAEPATQPARKHLEPPPGWLQAVAAYAEYIGGPMLAFGALTRLASLGIIGVMVGALALVHLQNNDPFVAASGPTYERAVVYLACGIALFILGPGRFSVDSVLFRDTNPPPPRV